MARYGFNLGEIQGLTYDIPVINVSIKRGEVSYNYTFTFNDEEEAWVLENVGRIYDAGGSFYLTADFNESDVGDTYNVTISTSAVEENFKSAVETVLEESGGNKGIMQVNMTKGELGGVTCDKTFNEVLAALNNGTFVSVKATTLAPEGTAVTCECFSQDESNTTPSKLAFGGVHVEDSYPGSLYGVLAIIDPEAQYNSISVFKITGSTT